MLADLINFEELLPLAIFGMFAAAAWWTLEVLANGRTRADERLDEIKNPALRRGREAGDKKTDSTMSRVFEKASPAFAKPLRPTDELEAGKLKTKLANAGFRSETATTIYLGLKFLGLIVGLVGGAALMLGMYGMTQKAMMYTILLAGGLFYMPDLVRILVAKHRREAIFLGLPDALDLMVVCVEAGLGLDQAMRKVSDEMKKLRVLSQEFGLSNLHLQMGRPRAQVLHELGVRTGVNDLRSLAAILIQADKFGSSIAQALRVQSDSMRTRRRQLAEERAAKTAVKLIFPLVLFIFPGIFVVLVGPAAITMVREMFPKMGGS